jgi:plasmid stability protein
MAESTAAMMIRDVPIDLRMQLRVIAAVQRRRLRDVAIEALQEKVEKHTGEGKVELGLSEEAASSH